MSKKWQSIKRLTDLNLHGEAMLRGAVMLGEKELAETFASINHRHVALGHLSWELNHERHAAFTKLKTAAQTKLTPADYQAFYASF